MKSHYPPGQSVYLESKSGMNPGSRMQNYTPDKRVYYKYTNTSLSFDFYDRDAYEVRILNLTGQAGTLTADGWMDNINFSTSNAEQSNSAWLLYTKNPKFTVTTNSGFPVLVLNTLENNIYKVTISN